AVRADVDVVEEHLPVLDAREAVAQVDPSLADRLHLGAEQHQTRLEGLEEMEIVVRLPVLGDIGLRLFAIGFFRHDRRPAKAGPYRSRPAKAGPYRCRASFAASNTAAIMLSGSARPLPAMSN